MKKCAAAAVLLIALLLMSACGGTKTIIDWVDFVKLNDISYVSDGDLIADDHVGEKIGEVTGNVPDEIDGKYKGDLSENGDAAFLPVGTALYAVKGYPEDTYVAAFVDGHYKLYKTMDSADLPFAVDSSSGEADGADGSAASSGIPSDPGTTGGGKKDGGTTGATGGAKDGTAGGSTKPDAPDTTGGASFDAEVIGYVRTYGHVGALIPNGALVRSVAELDSLYKSKGPASGFDSTGSLSKALDPYDAAFFKSKYLAVIDIEETSGSNRLEVTDVKAAAGTLTVTVRRVVPEVGTCDMAHWYILVPVDRADYSVFEAVFDGKSYELFSSRSKKAGTGGEAVEPVIEQVSGAVASAPPGLGLQTQKGKTVCYTPATMGGASSWTSDSGGGKTRTVVADSVPPYLNNAVATLRYGGTDGSVMLVTSGKVTGVSVKRYAERYDGTGDGETVSVSKSTFALKSGSYYEIAVSYAQGTAVYGFKCTA